MGKDCNEKAKKHPRRVRLKLALLSANQEQAGLNAEQNRPRPGGKTRIKHRHQQTCLKEDVEHPRRRAPAAQPRPDCSSPWAACTASARRAPCTCTRWYAYMHASRRIYECYETPLPAAVFTACRTACRRTARIHRDRGHPEPVADADLGEKGKEGGGDGAPGGADGF